MEYLDIYTAKKQRTRNRQLRGQTLAEGDYFFVVTVLLFNQAGELLIQKRQATKSCWPDWWDYTASGAVIQGEELYQAAERELFEEIGLVVDLHDTPSRLTVSFENGWNEIYFITKDVAIEQLQLQVEEVSAAKWVTLVLSK